jgi:NAD(P)-dependent dehydrogenase (short-subunit alcohol dehydrogenase family)
MRSKTNPFDLAGRVAIVTGSTKGLGRAIAQGLAEAGAAVVVSSRKQDLCEQVAAEIGASTGRDTLGLACHAGDWDAIPGFIDAVVARFGRIDVLVNNAGINPAAVAITDITREYWHKVLAVNLDGPLRMAQCTAPIMRDAGGGSIVNIASMAAYRAGPGNVAYGASKAALVNVTRTMAIEWAPWSVRVNVVCPGPIKSAMTEGAERTSPGWYDRASLATMQKRTADTEEIVGPVLYFASDASSFVTGEDHCVSGGMLR